MSIYAYTGNDKALQYLLKKRSIDVKYPKSEMPCTILCSAVLGQHLSTVKLLLQYGINPNDGQSLSTAISQDDEEIVQYMLNHGACFDANHPLSLAHTHNPDMIKSILSSGVDPYLLIEVAAIADNDMLLKLSMDSLQNHSNSSKYQININKLNKAISSAKWHGYNDIIKLIEEYARTNHLHLADKQNL
jgi:ankyrin repeat protein